MRRRANLLRRAFGHTRAYFVLFSTGLSSVSGLLLSVCAARVASIEQMGAFALGFASFSLVLGLSQAMVAEPLSARLPERTLQAAGARQVSLESLGLGALIVVVGIAIRNDFVIAAGLAAHGICLANYMKLMSTVFGRPWHGVIQEATRLVCFIACLALPTVREDSKVVFAVWLGFYAAVGYAAVILQGFSILPRVQESPVGWGESFFYGVEFVLGSGTTHISAFGLGAWANPSVNAAIRGAGTLLGPVATLSAVGKMLLIPMLSRSRLSNGSRAAARRSTVAMLLVSVPAIAAINILPPHVLQTLLGDTWEVSRLVLPALSLEAVLALISTVPFAGHRSEGAHRRTVLLRAIVSPFRLLLIIVPGVVFGPIGAALGTLIATLVTAIVWWASYLQLTK